MSLPEFAVRQAVLVNILFVGVIVAGLFGFSRVPVEVYPDISFDEAIVTTSWPGASADEVERLVTTRLEREIREDVDGIRDLESSSIAGLSSISVEWDFSLSDSGQASALADLRAAIDRVADLPADVKETTIRELSVGELRAPCLVAVADIGGVGEHAIREIARALEREIERLLDVRKATMLGARDREIHVLLDRERALQYDLTIPEISAAIARNNQNIPAGTFLDATRGEIAVRGLGSFTTPEALAASVIKKDAQGRHVTLGEIARVEPGFETQVQAGRYNGAPAIFVSVSHESGSDVRSVVKRVRGAVEEFRALLPPGVEITITQDTSHFVNARMALLRSNLLIGVVAVVAVLWLSVGFRSALLALLAVPFSFLFAFALFPSLGMGINSLSLIGLVMVSGMLVDHTIIIIENIYRHIEEGEELRSAIIEGAREVMWPVITTVATTIAAFMPMFLVSGTPGEFFSLFPKAVIVVLCGSLLEALIVLPAHYLDWGRRRGRDAQAAPPAGWLGFSARLRSRADDLLGRARGVYLRGLEAVIRHRAVFLAACVAALFFSCGLSRHVQVDLFKSDFDQIFVNLDAPIDAGIAQTTRAMGQVDEALRGMGGTLTDYTANIGMKFEELSRRMGANYGVTVVSFPNTRENVARPERVLEAVRAEVAPLVDASADIENIYVVGIRNGPPVGWPVAIRVAADDYRLAKEVAGELKAELATIPGIYNIQDNTPLGPREFRVRLDEARASLHGLSFQDVGLALRAANDGLVSSTFKDPGSDEDVDIRVMLPEAQRQSFADLLEVEIRTPTGGRVKLGDVARIEVDRSYRSLAHYEGRRVVTVRANVDGENATSFSANSAMKARFADVSARWPGVSLMFGGEGQATERSIGELGSAFLLAVIAIYAILAAQFRSYAQPLLVMSVISFAYIGVIFGMWLLGYALTMYVIYAVIGLAGIVVNDSLVLIDFVNRGRARGLSPVEAVRASCRVRFRPIVLTSVTTIAGLLPMALGAGGTHPVFGPFATGLVFGLAVAGGLTLYTVPALYLLLEGAKQRIANWRGLVRGLT
ncbi:MAG: efflux RND transporter permease subunit [Deltaproteobacteria bacterium]|nr:efflux RND transporter permease subunit [Deltaproteobacteria bacterium]MDD9827076.1 efflux RND transporter permease subunit [Deltaproteobacteria bacterium]MDD9854331.1 efflux RND transporter permease subunit [Deltaproteobacteria bacterium]MDD9873701.1 efflux RND transporter permease subunit [Deltaproteobacteria bacterium]